MFTPDQQAAAHEMHRVCRNGGSIGMANWTPDSFIGQVFKVLGKYVPPVAGVKPPSLWGTEQRLKELFPATCDIGSTKKTFAFRYTSPEHWLDVFRTLYGPVHKAFGALQPTEQAGLKHDLLDLIARENRAGDGTMVVDSAYLEVIIRKP
jgi:hypothetical protein